MMIRMKMPFPVSAIRSSNGLRPFQRPSPGLSVKSSISLLPRQFHSATLLLARRTRERNRPRPPIHPSVPSFTTSPDDPKRTATSRRRLLGFKTRANSDIFGWKLDSTRNVLRRRDGVAGKYEHSKVDWAAEKRRKFFKQKQEEKEEKLDERHVARRSRDSTATNTSNSNETVNPPIKEWSLPSREWNRGAPSLVNEYGREFNPIYSFERRQSLALLRKTALAHEKRRHEMLSQGCPLTESRSQDSSFWDYEKNFRNPLYDFFRGGLTMEESSIADSTYHCWSVAQLRRKSFQDFQVLWYILLKERNLLLAQRREAQRVFRKLVDPASPGEPLSTIRRQLKAVQFSLRNIKVAIAERRRAIIGRIKFLTNYQSKRGRDPYFHQWQIAIELERQRIGSSENHELKEKDLDEYFASSQGRDRIQQILSKQGLRASALLGNLKAFDRNKLSKSQV